MYSQFFGFKSNPFSQTPPSNNDYLPGSHFSILNQLSQAIKISNGLFLLLGSIGVGKSSLIKVFTNKNKGMLISDLTPASRLHLSTSSHLEMMLNRISNSNSTPAIFFLDNADHYDNSLLSILFFNVAERINNNIPTLLILTGQPTLELNIREMQVENASSLLLHSVSLPPFKNTEIKKYIHYRLKQTDYSKKELFTDDAIQRIASLSRGLPRLINTICGGSIFQASLEGLTIINEEVVDLASEFCFLSNDMAPAKEPIELSGAIQEIPKQSKLQEISTIQNTPNIILEKNNISIAQPNLPYSENTHKALAYSSTVKADLVSENETKITSTAVDLKSKDYSISSVSNQEKITPSEASEQTNHNQPNIFTFFAYRFPSLFFFATIILLVTFILWDRGFQYLSPDSTPTSLSTMTIANNTLSPSLEKDLITQKITLKLTAPKVSKENIQLPQTERQELNIDTDHQEWLALENRLLKNNNQKPINKLKTVDAVSNKTELENHQVALLEVRKQNVQTKTYPEKNRPIRTTKTIFNKNLAVQELAVKKRTSARYKLSQKGISYNLNSYFSSVEKGNNQLFKLFLDANMPIDIQKKPTGNTILIKATKKGYLDIVTTALNRKAMINQQNKEGKTALITAARYGHYSISHKLLNHGAKIHITDNKGRDALMIAVQSNQLAIVKDLLKYGANKNTKDSTGLTALLIAQNNNQHQIVSLLDR